MAATVRSTTSCSPPVTASMSLVTPFSRRCWHRCSSSTDTRRWTAASDHPSAASTSWARPRPGRSVPSFASFPGPTTPRERSRDPSQRHRAPPSTASTRVEPSKPGEMTPRLPLAGAVVIGSEYRQLGLVRSLGRHGIPVWVLAGDHWLGRVTRYARRTFAWPRGTEADRLAFLIRLSREHHLERWALIPGEDQEAALIARHHAELAEHYVLTTPPWSVVQWAHDKRLTYRLADEL